MNIQNTLFIYYVIKKNLKLMHVYQLLRYEKKFLIEAHTTEEIKVVKHRHL